MLVGFAIVAPVASAWRYQRDQPLVHWSAPLALVLLPIQVFLGRLTVTKLLVPVVVTSHLRVAILILLLLTVSTTRAWTCYLARVA